ncbi:MAG TPA: hypothetical protein PK156_17160 [Polyangium sp.]|nr:hypothetical protein [Polyangium sp.]
MNDHPLHLLHDYYFDRLKSDRRAEVHGHIAACTDCAGRVEALARAVEEVPAMAPRQDLQDRLFRSVEHLERFAPHARRVGELVDLSPNEARRALHMFADIDSWVLGPLPGMRASRVPSRTKRAVFACFEASSRVPNHRHLERESILVFQGAFETSAGSVIRAGEELHSDQGSVHAIARFLDDIDCLCVIVNPDRIVYEEPPLAGEEL